MPPEGQEHRDATAAVETSTVGEAFVSRIWVVILTVVFLLAALVTLVHLWVLWPTALTVVQEGGDGQPATRRVSYFGLTHAELSTEILFFAVVALSGALGGLIHALRSLGRYVGTRTLRWSWAPFYLLLPLIGALGGTVFYVILRAGLFSPSSSIDQASPFGFSAVAALVGLFSEQAMEKLRDVAANIFTRTTPLTDHFEATTEPAGRDRGKGAGT